MSGGRTITLEMIYEEVRKVREEIGRLEDLIEALLIEGLPEAELSPGELEEVRRALEEMKRGEYMTLEELKE